MFFSFVYYIANKVLACLQSLLNIRVEWFPLVDAHSSRKRMSEQLIFQHYYEYLCQRFDELCSEV